MLVQKVTSTSALEMILIFVVTLLLESYVPMVIFTWSARLSGIPSSLMRELAHQTKQLWAPIDLVDGSKHDKLMTIIRYGRT